MNGWDGNIVWKKEKNRMCVEEKAGVVYLTFPEYKKQDWLWHGFSTRIGGVSEGDCASMNLSFSRGDKEEHVQENYRRIADAIGFPVESIICSQQTHTTNVHLVTKADCGKGVIYPLGYTDVDGMITNEPGVVLATSYADCVPLYFVDPVKKAIGLSHSGWRGTVGKMGKVTVEKMQEVFGTNPKDIIAAIGPSICQNCYEVSEDVAEAFRAAFDSEFHDALLYKKESEKYQLDLWKANEFVFLEAGILKENIFLPGICTCCNPTFLFSHRASKGKRGNLSAFLGIRGN